MIDDSRRRRDRGRFAGLTGGLILIVIGTAFLLSELHLYPMRHIWRWWPSVLVALGVGRLLTAESWRRRKGGLVMIMIGLWGFINVWEIGPFYWDNSWPLLLIGFGLLAVAEVALHERGLARGSEPSGTFDGMSVTPPLPPPPSPAGPPLGGSDVR